MKIKRIPLYLYFLLFLVCLNIIAGYVFLDFKNKRFLQVIFFNVGQGDAIFIETPQRHQILIDGGPDGLILEKLPKIMPFWDRNIDLIVLTHPEKDHLEGLLNVLEKYKVDNIVWTGVKRKNSEFKKWEELILKEKANVQIVKAHQKIIAGKVILNIIFPLEDMKDKEIDKTNDTSIVSKLVFRNISFLFTGDISQKAEKEIINQNVNLSSDILKISHHGSKNSSSIEFIERVLPKIAVISVGKNNLYYHPHQEVLDILKKYDIKILRTDLNGDIKIISDGEKIKI